MDQPALGHGTNNDWALIRRTLDGDLTAYEELVKRYQSAVYGLIYHMTANHEDAADLAQETFIKAYNALGSFKGDSGFFTWLYRIAINTTLNHLKRRARQGEMYLNDLSPEVSNDPYVGPVVSTFTPDREAILAELQKKLNEALLKLSENHRVVVILHDIQGLKHEEIAKILGCNVGTVRSRLFYARQQLKAYLSDYLK